MIILPTFRGVLRSISTTAWSPQDLGPIIWIDPHDSGTVFDSISGGSTPAYDTEVHRIVNKASGYGSYEFFRNTTSGGLIRKQGTAATNYKDYLYGSSALQGLQRSVTDIGKGAAGVTAFIVGQCSANPVASTVAFFWAEVNGGGGLGRIYLDAGRGGVNKLGILSRRADSGGSTVLSTTSSTPTALNVFGGKFEFYDSKCSTYVNSTAENSSNPSAYGATGTNCANTTSSFSSIGGNTTSGTVNIGEIVVVNRSLSSAEMTSLVNYLNAKWRNA